MNLIGRFVFVRPAWASSCESKPRRKLIAGQASGVAAPVSV